MNYYAILGIPRDADQEHIRNAYKLLARRYHPDTGAGSNAEKFREVAAAYATLSNPGHRAEDDRSLAAGERMSAPRVENPEVFGRRVRVSPDRCDENE